MNLKDQKHQIAATLVKHLSEIVKSERPALFTGLKRQLNEWNRVNSTLSLVTAERLINHYNKYISGLYLRIYGRVSVEDFGLYGYAIASSRNVRTGLRLSQQFLSLTTTYYQESLYEDEDGLSIVPNIDSHSTNIQVLSEDFAAGYWALLKHIITGNRADMEKLVFEFCYPAPRHLALYDALFVGCTLRFNQPATQIRFPAAWLNAPISLERIKVDAMLPSQLVDEPTLDQPSRAVLEQRIIAIVVGSHFTQITMPDIATELSLSARQLRYWLNKSNLSLRDIVLSARMSVATRLLTSTELDIGTIAETLNYSESSAFVRSFKLFFAVSPLQYRFLHLEASWQGAGVI
ncbi:AraC family transcriptional regulator [Vibrio hangzhouensis]|uniref:AraC family transcriptional regulator n=1 Tax=Vibrio hangzhouensis TaxID=462991 RepID=UPI001C94F624|nr:AraC family transcriptional regulator [Vibrio hangzhouensis]MBY6195745.1 AraC family transcriptional regulator [Vibrio hangzhouensis]